MMKKNKVQNLAPLSVFFCKKSADFALLQYTEGNNRSKLWNPELCNSPKIARNRKKGCGAVHCARPRDTTCVANLLTGKKQKVLQFVSKKSAIFCRLTYQP
jgi:hypothetical protein